MHAYLCLHLAAECRVEIVGHDRGLTGLSSQLDLMSLNFRMAFEITFMQQTLCDFMQAHMHALHLDVAIRAAAFPIHLWKVVCLDDTCLQGVGKR